MRSITALVCSLVALTISGCSPELMHPRSAGQRLSDRPERAMVVGEFKIVGDGINANDIGTTPHQVIVGKDSQTFRDEIPDDGKGFALWVVPGVFCFGQPSVGAAVLGGARPCIEIPEKGKAYYVGSVTWKVKKKDGAAAEAELRVENKFESVSSSPLLVGVPLETTLVSQDMKQPESVAAKYSAK